MMAAFDARQGLIMVEAHLWGPEDDVAVRLALDTGATSTLINERILRLVGYDPEEHGQKVLITTGSGIESAAVIRVSKLAALRQERREFSVTGYTLPKTTAVDGLLGLDFMRGKKLTVDFLAARV